MNFSAKDGIGVIKLTRTPNPKPPPPKKLVLGTRYVIRWALYASCGLIVPQKVYIWHTEPLSAKPQLNHNPTLQLHTPTSPPDLTPHPSLREIAIMALKDVKSCLFSVLRVPNGYKAPSLTSATVIIMRLWHLRLEASHPTPPQATPSHPSHPQSSAKKIFMCFIFICFIFIPSPQVRLAIEPFWTVLRLKDGLAKLYAKFPFLLHGELSDPCYLGQAVCDEKDERVQVFLFVKTVQSGTDVGTSPKHKRTLHPHH